MERVLPEVEAGIDRDPLSGYAPVRGEGGQALQLVPDLSRDVLIAGMPGPAPDLAAGDA